MARSPRTGPKAAAKAWLTAETRRGGRAARPAVALGLLGSASAIGQAFCIAAILATALAGHGANTPALGGFAALALARAGLAWGNERAAAAAGAASRRRRRSDILARLLHAGPAALRTRHSADLTAIVVDRIEALDGLYARWIPASTLALAGPALVALAALWADPVAALVLVLAGLLVPLGMAAAGIGAAAASRRQFQAMERLSARFLDRMRGIATIVLYGRTQDEAAALATAADALRARTMRVLRVAFLSSAALDLAAALALVLLAIRYGGMILAHRLTDPATALFALLLVPEFFAPLRAFALAYQDRLHAMGAADALRDLPPAPEPVPPREIRTVAAHGIAVAFEDVSFTWDQARGTAIDGLSLRVAAGETLILAGPSGAGKSTVIELLLGFVHPDRGRITFNGADIADLVPAALSQLTAWIGQRPVLFAGTIRENIRFARPEATDPDIEDAARAAKVTEFAAALPQGLETPIGEGGFGLSGGQAQRVAIARAFLRDAPLLLLDEPTAHLDPATEADILDSLRRLTIGRTVILASHSSAAHALSGRRLDLRDGRAVVAPARETA